jgi:hypothetical protein
VCICLCLCSCTIEDYSYFSLHDVGIDFLFASIVMAILVTSLQIILLATILAKSSYINICKEFFCSNPCKDFLATFGKIFLIVVICISLDSSSLCKEKGDITSTVIVKFHLLL